MISAKENFKKAKDAFKNIVIIQKRVLLQTVEERLKLMQNEGQFRTNLKVTDYESEVISDVMTELSKVGYKTTMLHEKENDFLVISTEHLLKENFDEIEKKPVETERSVETDSGKGISQGVFPEPREGASGAV